MHIVLDSNIYAADYRMNGVAFQSLFEYLRRTESRLVLPNAIREEVVIDYGRRLKAGAKAFEDAWRKYHHLDLHGDFRDFEKPDGKYAMTRLRRHLMNPTEGIKPIYVPEITGTFLHEAFMRGVHRTRPANDNGEELRDVILWLWTLAYSDDAGTEVAFVSNDNTFWADDRPHPDIERDVNSKNGRLHVHRSIQEFLKAHAPAPGEISADWIQQHFKIESIERELIGAAARELNRPRAFTVSDLSIKEYKIKAAKLYEVSQDSQFAELELQLVFKFMRLPPPEEEQSVDLFGRSFGRATKLSKFWGPATTSFLSPASPLFGNPEPPPEEPAKELECKADAKVSLRIKDEKATEISVDTFTIDRSDLFSVLYG
jgi:hypothetical protein